MNMVNQLNGNQFHTIFRELRSRLEASTFHHTFLILVLIYTCYSTTISAFISFLPLNNHLIREISMLRFAEMAEAAPAVMASIDYGPFVTEYAQVCGSTYVYADAVSVCKSYGDGEWSLASFPTRLGYVAFKAGMTSMNTWFGADDNAVEGSWRWVDGRLAGRQFWSGLAPGGSCVSITYPLSHLARGASTTSTAAPLSQTTFNNCLTPSTEWNLDNANAGQNCLRYWASQAKIEDLECSFTQPCHACERSQCNTKSDCFGADTISVSGYYPNCNCTCSGGRWGPYCQFPVTVNNTAYISEYSFECGNSKTGTQAAATCSAKGNGWHLATFPTLASFTAFRNVLQTTSSVKLNYLGTNDAATEGRFIWSHGRLAGSEWYRRTSVSVQECRPYQLTTTALTQSAANAGSGITQPWVDFGTTSDCLTYWGRSTGPDSSGIQDCVAFDPAFSMKMEDFGCSSTSDVGCVACERSYCALGTDCILPNSVSASGFWPTCTCGCALGYSGAICEVRSCHIQVDCVLPNTVSMSGTYPSCQCTCKLGYGGKTCKRTRTMTLTLTPTESTTASLSASHSHSGSVSLSQSLSVGPNSRSSTLGHESVSTTASRSLLPTKTKSKDNTFTSTRPLSSTISATRTVSNRISGDTHVQTATISSSPSNSVAGTKATRTSSLSVASSSKTLTSTLTTSTSLTSSESLTFSRVDTNSNTLDSTASLTASETKSILHTLSLVPTPTGALPPPRTASNFSSRTRSHSAIVQPTFTSIFTLSRTSLISRTRSSAAGSESASRTMSRSKLELPTISLTHSHTDSRTWSTVLSVSVSITKQASTSSSVVSTLTASRMIPLTLSAYLTLSRSSSESMSSSYSQRPTLTHPVQSTTTSSAAVSATHTVLIPPTRSAAILATRSATVIGTATQTLVVAPTTAPDVPTVIISDEPLQEDCPTAALSTYNGYVNMSATDNFGNATVILVRNGVSKTTDKMIRDGTLELEIVLRTANVTFVKPQISLAMADSDTAMSDPRSLPSLFDLTKMKCKLGASEIVYVGHDGNIIDNYAAPLQTQSNSSNLTISGLAAYSYNATRRIFCTFPATPAYKLSGSEQLRVYVPTVATTRSCPSDRWLVGTLLVQPESSSTVAEAISAAFTVVLTVVTTVMMVIGDGTAVEMQAMVLLFSSAMASTEDIDSVAVVRHFLSPVFPNPNAGFILLCNIPMVLVLAVAHFLWFRHILNRNFEVAKRLLAREWRVLQGRRKTSQRLQRGSTARYSDEEADESFMRDFGVNEVDQEHEEELSAIYEALAHHAASYTMFPSLPLVIAQMLYIGISAATIAIFRDAVEISKVYGGDASHVDSYYSLASDPSSFMSLPRDTTQDMSIGAVRGRVAAGVAGVIYMLGLPVLFIFLMRLGRGVHFKFYAWDVQEVIDPDDYDPTARGARRGSSRVGELWKLQPYWLRKSDRDGFDLFSYEALAGLNDKRAIYSQRSYSSAVRKKLKILKFQQGVIQTDIVLRRAFMKWFLPLGRWQPAQRVNFMEAVIASLYPGLELWTLFPFVMALGYSFVFVVGPMWKELEAMYILAAMLGAVAVVTLMLIQPYRSQATTALTALAYLSLSMLAVSQILVSRYGTVTTDDSSSSSSTTSTSDGQLSVTLPPEWPMKVKLLFTFLIIIFVAVRTIHNLLLMVLDSWLRKRNVGSNLESAAEAARIKEENRIAEEEDLWSTWTPSSNKKAVKEQNPSAIAMTSPADAIYDLPKFASAHSIRGLPIGSQPTNLIHNTNISSSINNKSQLKNSSDSANAPQANPSVNQLTNQLTKTILRRRSDAHNKLALDTNNSKGGNNSSSTAYDDSSSTTDGDGRGIRGVPRRGVDQGPLAVTSSTAQTSASTLNNLATPTSIYTPNTASVSSIATVQTAAAQRHVSPRVQRLGNTPILSNEIPSLPSSPAGGAPLMRAHTMNKGAAEQAMASASTTAHNTNARYLAAAVEASARLNVGASAFLEIPSVNSVLHPQPSNPSGITLPPNTTSFEFTRRLYNSPDTFASALGAKVMAQLKKCLKHLNVCQSDEPVVEDMDEGSISNTQTAGTRLGAPGSTVLQLSNGSPPRSGVFIPTDNTNDILQNQLQGLRGFVGTVPPQRVGGGGGGHYYRRSSAQLPLESVESPPLAPPSDFGSDSERLSPRPPAALHYVSGPIGYNSNKPHFQPIDSPLFRNTANASFTYSNLDNSGYAEAAAAHNNNYFGTGGRSGEGHRHEAATHRNQHAASYDPTSVQTISLAATPTRAMRGDPAFAETPLSGQIDMPRFESIEARHPTLEEHSPTTQQNQPASHQSKNRKPSRVLSPDSQPGFSTVLQFAPLISVVKPSHSSAVDPQADAFNVESGGAGSSAAATRKTTYHGNNTANAAASSFNNNNTLSDLGGTARSGSGVVTAMDDLGNSVSLARTSPGYGNSPATYHRRRLGSGVFNAPMPMLSFSNRLPAMGGSASEMPGAGESSNHYFYGPGRPWGNTPVSTPRNVAEVPADIQRLVTIFTSALTTSSEQQSPARQSSTSQQDYDHQETGLPALSELSIGANGGLLSPHQQAATTTSNELSTRHHNASILSLDSVGQSSSGSPAKKPALTAKIIQKPKTRIEARLTNGPPDSTLFQHPAEKRENDARQERKPLVVVNENEFDWLVDSVLGAGESRAAVDGIEFESLANASGGEF